MRAVACGSGSCLAPCWRRTRQKRGWLQTRRSRLAAPCGQRAADLCRHPGGRAWRLQVPFWLPAGDRTRQCCALPAAPARAQNRVGGHPAARHALQSSLGVDWGQFRRFARPPLVAGRSHGPSHHKSHPQPHRERAQTACAVAQYQAPGAKACGRGASDCERLRRQSGRATFAAISLNSAPLSISLPRRGLTDADTPAEHLAAPERPS